MDHTLHTWTLCVILNLAVLWTVCAYNVDKTFPVLIHGNGTDYFGYSVAFHQNRDATWALVSAPRSNSSILRDIVEPGVLFSCNITDPNNPLLCTELILDRLGNTYTSAGNELSYMDKKDNMWLGVSLDVQQGNSKENNIVVCGHLWKNQFYSGHYLTNGACYVINSDLDPQYVKKLVPFRRKSKQGIPPGIYYYAFGQVGFSAAFSDTGEHLFLGAPGFCDWMGTVVTYEKGPIDNVINFDHEPIIPNPPSDQNLSPEPYIGYATTSGKFFDGQDIFMAVGAPRDGNGNGRVYLVEALSEQQNRFVVHYRKEGSQFGEYFGAAVLGVNLNNDAFTDLLVGAPFSSTESGIDEGKVYVYISNGVGLQSFAELTGGNKLNARFGTCIANAGDLNQDGFNDVAIGAPYEEKKGAIYIYHGTSTGLNNQYIQKITASEIDSTLEGFGISISRGMDIDGNHYPDLLVGSYASSNAVLFRTHPIIQISAKIEFNPPLLNTNTTPCFVEGENVSCINVTSCLQYAGKRVQPSLNFITALTMDVDRRSNNPRAYFMSENVVSLNRNKRANIDQDACFEDTVYIRKDTKDLITPMKFLLEFKLAEPVEKNIFCKACPIIDPKIPTNIKKTMSFQTGCFEVDRCYSDLVVEARVLDTTSDVPLIIGENNTLTLDINVINLGEPAYLSRLFIFLPDEIPVIKQSFCSILSEQDKQQIKANLLCELGNPLKNKMKSHVQIKIDTSKLSTNTKQLNFYMETKTASYDINSTNSKSNISVTFKGVADIVITGTPEQEQIAYIASDDRDGSVLISHTYNVMNNGPSPLQIINIELLVPTTIHGEKDVGNFLSFRNLEVDSGQQLTIPAKCNDTSIVLKPIDFKVEKGMKDVFNEEDLVAYNESINASSQEISFQSSAIYPSLFRSKRSAELNTVVPLRKRKDVILSCETASCIKIYCYASPFLDQRKYAQIKIEMEVNISILDEALPDPWDRIDFFTYGKIFAGGENVELKSKNPNSHEISVKTVVVRPGPLPPEELAKWIVYVSIAVGVVLLIIILIVLFQIGFFKRKQKDKMKEMMLQADLKEWEPYIINREAPDEEYPNGSAETTTDNT